MSRRTGWALPVALVALCLVPVTSGALRLVPLAAATVTEPLAASTAGTSAGPAADWNSVMLTAGNGP